MSGEAAAVAGGGPARDARAVRPTIIASLLLSLLLLVASSGAVRADATADVLGRLADAASCSDKASPLRVWCPAASWAKGKPAALKPGLMVGVTVAIAADSDVRQALSDKVTFVLLVVDKDGPQLSATLRDVNPESDDEARSVAEAIAGVATVLKGKARTVKLPKDLRAFADSLRGRSTRAVLRGKTGWTWTTEHNQAELRRVGTVWVVIETPRDGGAGRFVTVLTDKVK